MKLYYAPAACSLAPHIAALEAGLKLDLAKVEFGPDGPRVDGRDFRTVNPKGYVPTLELDGGEILTENAVILQYLADQAPAAGLAPSGGGLERWHFLELLNFIATEIHKGFSPLFKPKTPPQMRDLVIETLGTRFDLVERMLEGKTYLTGERFTIADAYAFTVLNWANFHKIDFGPRANLKAYMQRVAQRPAVQQAFREEGLA